MLNVCERRGVAMKERYEALEAEVLHFESVDIITTSPGNDNGTTLPYG